MKGNDYNKIEQERFRVLIDNAPETVLILDAETGKFIDFNQNALHFFKLSKETLLASGPVDLSPKLVHGHESASYAKSFINEALQGGNPVFDWTHTDSEGREIPCEVRLVRFPPYHKQLVRASIIDRTPQLKMELALQESEERLQLVLRASGLGSYDWYPDEGKLQWDDQMHELFGLPLLSPIDRNEYFHSVLHPEDKERLDRAFSVLMAPESEETTFRDEYRIYRQGEIRHMVANSLFFRNNQGKIIRIIGTVQDVTQQKQIENELKTTLDQLQLAVHTAKLGIWRLTIETDHLEWNDQMLEIYGLSRSEFEANLDRWRSMVHPEDQADANSRLAQIFEGKNIYDVAFRVIRPNGTIRYVSASGSPLYDEKGTLTGLIGINYDVTSLKKREEVLREREAFLRAIFDHSLNAIMVADDNGNYLSVNQAAADMFGYSIAELEQMNVSDLRAHAPADPVEQYRKYLEKGQEIGELSFVHTDGENRVAVYHAVRIDKNFTLSILADITDRIHANEKLTKTQQELSEITERLQISTQAAKVGIWDWNIKKDALHWDDTMLELYGISRNDFTATAAFWQTRLHPEELEHSRQEMRLALKGEKEFNTEFRIVWPDQSIHYIKALATVQRDNTGKAVRMIGTNWDITREKEAEFQKIRARQLELKNKELEQFAYIASHDLREPLRTVISFAGLLKKRHEDKLDADANQYMTYISQAANRMDKLVKGLLDYSRIGTNKTLSIVNCNALLNHILQDLSAQISEAGAIIDLAPLPPLRGYETELRILFQNLIANAIKFSKKDARPVVQISCQKIKGYWQFCVKDNGIGIAPAYQKKIFVIFQRLHNDEQYQGAGIGLSHCQKIVDLHGGQIWVESKLGEGSSFFFTIPDGG